MYNLKFLKNMLIVICILTATNSVFANLTIKYPTIKGLPNLSFGKNHVSYIAILDINIKFIEGERKFNVQEPLSAEMRTHLRKLYGMAYSGSSMDTSIYNQV